MNQPEPSPDVVEAALRLALFQPMTKEQMDILSPGGERSHVENALQALAGEVGRLRVRLTQCSDEMHEHGGLLAFDVLHDLQSEPFILEHDKQKSL